MFRIEIHVDDKNMGELLKRVTGIAKVANYNFVNNVSKVKDIHPPTNGKTSYAVRAENAQELFINELRRREFTTFRAPEIKDVLGTIGYSPTSINYFLQGAFKNGHIKKNGKGYSMTYTLVGGKS